MKPDAVVSTAGAPCTPAAPESPTAEGAYWPTFLAEYFRRQVVVGLFHCSNQERMAKKLNTALDTGGIHDRNRL
jgi:hypothetical protein